MCIKGEFGRSSAILGRLLALLLAGAVLACGHIRPVPEGFNPEDYQVVSLDQLRAPRRAGLEAGQKVRVEGFFWQYLDYDPRLAANYLTLARQPLAWSRLRWASLYRTASMRGYYDLLALAREQQHRWDLKRLDRVRVYGELAPLGFGTLYLRVHHIDRLDEAAGLPEPGEPTSAADREPPGL